LFRPSTDGVVIPSLRSGFTCRSDICFLLPAGLMVGAVRVASVARGGAFCPPALDFAGGGGPKSRGAGKAARRRRPKHGAEDAAGFCGGSHPEPAPLLRGLRRKHACVSCGGDFPVHFGFWRWWPPHGLSHPEVFKKPQKSPAAFTSKGGPRSFAASVPISSSRHLQKNQVDLFAGIVQGLKARPWLQPRTPPNSDQAKVSA